MLLSWICSRLKRIHGKHFHDCMDCSSAVSDAVVKSDYNSSGSFHAAREEHWERAFHSNCMAKRQWEVWEFGVWTGIWGAENFGEEERE